MGFEPVGFPQPPPPPPAFPPRDAPVPLPYALPVPQARLHPLTLFFAAWNAVRGFVIPALVVLFLRRGSRGLGWVPVAATMGAAALGWAMLKYYTFGYWVTDTPAGGELIIRSGVLAKTERHIPLARVQDVRLKQGLMHRLLRVVEVEIETAGGQGAEAKLSVLSQREAARLREAIFAHRAAPTAPHAAEAAAVSSGEPSGSGPTFETSAAPPRRTVRRVSTRELVLAGLTSNQVASGVAVIAGAFAFLDDLIDVKALGPQVAKVQLALAQLLHSGGPAAVVLLALGGIVLLGLVGVVISVFGSVLLFFGFELSLAGEDLHRSYGLITRHASSLPRRRIQLVRIEEGVLRRLLRLATLRVNSAGSKQTEGESNKGDDVLLPVVPRDEVAELLPVVFPDAAGHASPDWRHVSRRAVWRGTFRGSVLLLAITTGVVLLKGPLGLLLLTLIALVYGVNVLGYRNLGYAKDSGFFRTRRGWLSRATHVVPVRNVQAIVITQNPLDRRHGVATVQVDTAGQGAAAGPQVANVPWAEALSLATGLAHQAAEQRYRW
jgi:putative membrane protein